MALTHQEVHAKAEQLTRAADRLNFEMGAEIREISQEVTDVLQGLTAEDLRMIITSLAGKLARSRRGLSH